MLTLLNDAEWSQWSDSEIARRCGVHRDVVVHQRPKSIHAVTASIETSRTFVHHKTGKPTAMRTENIGKREYVDSVGCCSRHQSYQLVGSRIVAKRFRNGSGAAGTRCLSPPFELPPQRSRCLRWRLSCAKRVCDSELLQKPLSSSCGREPSSNRRVSAESILSAKTKRIL